MQALRSALQAWASEIIADMGSSIPVIWADGKGPRPGKAYMTLKIVSAPRTGRDEYIMLSGGGYGGDELASVATREGTLSINVVGDDALDILAGFDDRVCGIKSLDSLTVKGLSCRRSSGARDMTGMIETQPEQRAQMDLSIAWTSTVVSDTGPIETVEVTGEFIGGATEHETTITVGDTE